MSQRPLLFYLTLLMVVGMVGVLTAAENSKNDLSDTTEITDDELVIEPGNDPETLPEKIDNTVATKQKKRSIKMIVGGQSTDGLAKQVTLPVDD